MKGIELRNWQEDAAISTLGRFHGNEKFFLTHATPGGGKTVYALEIFEALKKEGKVSHCIILAPSTNLEKQWTSEALSLLDVYSNKTGRADLKNAMLYDGMSDFHEYIGMCITYQSMHNLGQELALFCSRHKTLVIADEMHHIADGQSWGESFRIAFDSAKHILGLTGTPWASNGKTIPHVTYDGKGYALPNYSYSKKDAIGDRVCRSVEFHRHKARNLSFSNRETGEFLGTYSTLDDAIEAKIKGAYLKTLQSVSHMESLFTPANEQVNSLRRAGRSRAAGLIVAPSIGAANAFRDEVFRLTGQEYPVVHSGMDKPHKVINDFKKSNTKWLISVDMITEGVDIKRLQVLVFLSSKNTELFVRQVAGRIERVIDWSNPLDRSAFFYYTDIEPLNTIILKMEDENRMGLAALDDSPEGPKGPGIDRPGPEGPERYDGVSLDEVETEFNGLFARGLDYDKSLVAEAIVRKRESALLANIELSVVCTFILADREKDKQTGGFEDSTNDDDNLPMSEKKANMRRGITERINSKLGQYLRRKPSGDDIRKAHRHINKAIGIKGTNESISYDELLRKFDYICETDAKTWMD